MTSALPATEPASAPRHASAGLPGLLIALFEAMRPAQWQKNLLLFAAFIFSSGKAWHINEPASWLPLIAASAGGFALFSLAASGGYLLNDVVYVERDRAHPRKRYRPIPSGRLPLRVAAVAGVVLLGGSVLAGLALDVRFGLVLLAYVALTAATRSRSSSSRSSTRWRWRWASRSARSPVRSSSTCRSPSGSTS
jgi:decaprenyl-phosphate phosphoribosyltransferase